MKNWITFLLGVSSKISKAGSGFLQYKGERRSGEKRLEKNAGNFGTK